jgi:hypothetical protein
VIGGFAFALARAKAALAPLVTLAAVSAIAAALIVGMTAAVQSAEAREVRAALAAAPGDLGRVVVTVSGAAADESAELVQTILAERGLAAAVTVSVDGDAVVIVPDTARIRGSDVGALREALRELGDEIETRTDAGAQVAGALETTLADVDAGVQARRGPTVVAVGILGLLTAVVVGAVAGASVRAREGENRLLRARGARRRDLVRAAGLETMVVAGIGAIGGGVLGASVSVLAAGVAPGAIAIIAAVGGIIAVAVTSGAVATSRGVDRGSTRARAAVDIGLAVVLAVLTGLAAWQFVQAGTPVVTRGDGTTILDPLVAIAPALVLGFAALLAVAVATPLARLIATALAPLRPVSPVTPMRLGSRRPARHALSIVSVAFALGSVVVAGAYGGTLAALGDAPEELRVGADVRVVTIPDDVEVADIAALQPSDASMLARSLGADGADARIPILAAEASRLGAVMSDAGGTIDPAALGDALALRAGQPLGGDTLDLTVVATVPPPVEVDGELVPQQAAAFYLRASVLSESGELRQFVFTNFEETENDGASFPDIRVDEVVEVSLPLPPGAQWSLVGLDAALYPFWFPGSVELQDVASGDGPVDVSDFGPAAGTPGAVEPIPAGLRITPALDGDDFPWTRAVDAGIPSSLPVAVTGGLADSLSLDEGDDFSLTIDSPDFAADFTVTAVIPILPGTAKGEGILVDLAALSLASPTEVLANQVWLASADPSALAAVVEEQFPQTTTLVADTRAAQNAAATWIGFALAAAGAVLLATVVLILRRTRSRADSRELAVLAAMGLGRARAARVRAQEDLATVLMGAVGGVIAGAATAWLVVPPLVRAAYGSVPAAYPVPLQAESLPLAVAIALALVLFVAVVLTVRAPARLAPLLREDE